MRFTSIVLLAVGIVVALHSKPAGGQVGTAVNQTGAELSRTIDEAKLEEIESTLKRYAQASRVIADVRGKIAAGERQLKSSEMESEQLLEKLKLIPNDPELVLQIVGKKQEVESFIAGLKYYEAMLADWEIKSAELRNSLVETGSSEISGMAEILAESLNTNGAGGSVTQRLKRTIEQLQQLSDSVKSQQPNTAVALVLRRNLMLAGEALDQLEQSVVGLKPPLGSVWDTAQTEHEKLGKMVEALEQEIGLYADKLAKSMNPEAEASPNVNSANDIELLVAQQNESVLTRSQIADIRNQNLLAQRQAVIAAAGKTAESDAMKRIDDVESRLSRIESLLEKIAERQNPAPTETKRDVESSKSDKPVPGSVKL